METMKFRQIKSLICTRLGLSDAIGKTSQCSKTQIIRKCENCHLNKAINGMDGIFCSWIFMDLCT